MQNKRNRQVNKTTDEHKVIFLARSVCFEFASEKIK